MRHLWEKRFHSVDIFIFVLAVCQFSVAGIRPSFEVRHATWQSTDIALVEAGQVGGQFTVIEALKGALHAGETVEIPELKPPANARSLASYPAKFFYNDRDPNTRIPKQVAGTRMILFLRRKVDRWIAATDWDDLKSSAVWIDQGQGFCYMQLMNPGPSALVDCRIDEATLRLKVIDIVELQQQLQDISRMEPSYRGKELQRFLASDLQKNPAQWIPDARKFVLEQLGQCGRPCLPQIREMLDDEGFSRVGAELVRALGKAGGVEIGSELTLRLQEELRYWRTIGPQLPVGWWNVDITEDAPLRLRYMKTLEIIQGLRETHHPSAKASVITLRDFWRSLPQLNDPSGLDQMAEECEQYLRSQP